MIEFKSQSLQFLGTNGYRSSSWLLVLEKIEATRCCVPVEGKTHHMKSLPPPRKIELESYQISKSDNQYQRQKGMLSDTTMGQSAKLCVYK